jgi:hypothetical protein
MENVDKGSPKLSNLGKDMQILEAEWYLFVLVAGVLMAFYLMIVWVLRSSDAERKSRLSKLG